MDKKKLTAIIGAIAAVAVAAFVVVSVIKTGDLPLTIEETYKVPAGGEVAFVDATGQGALALKVKVDLSSLTNLTTMLPPEAECWLLLGAEPKSETKALLVAP